MSQPKKPAEPALMTNSGTKSVNAQLVEMYAMVDELHDVTARLRKSVSAMIQTVEGDSR